MNNLRVKIPDFKDALMARFRRWLENRTFKGHKFREVLMGCTITIVMSEVACYRMVQGIVRFGGLPTYVPDMMIITMALLETTVSPFLSWLGYWRRRTVMVAVIPLLSLCTMTWLFLPDLPQHEESGLCYGSVDVTSNRMTQPASIRLGFVLVSCVLFLLARITIWCHGFAYMEEHAPDRVSVHLGVLVCIRSVSLALDYHMMGVVVKTSQIIAFVINFGIHVLQLLYFMPSRAPQGQQIVKKRTDDRTFFLSVRRVLSDPLAVSQMLSLGLLAAAAWGYGYHNTDIMKAKYLIHMKSENKVLLTELLQYFAILMAVLFVGLRWSVPLQEQFSKVRALRQSVLMCVLVGAVMMVLATKITCPRGRVAGLEGDGYTNPTCSVHCGCKAGWSGFSPVCVVDDMTTYLSPCQAGCAAVEDLGGLNVYKNCSCSVSTVALASACNHTDCRSTHGLHRMLYVLLLMFCGMISTIRLAWLVLGFQSHGVLLLKTVDARDKSVVLGLTGAVISLSAFVCGHIAFNAINAATCLWLESTSQIFHYSQNLCHMHSPRLPFLIGVVGAGLAFTSATICLITCICLKRAEKTEMTRL